MVEYNALYHVGRTLFWLPSRKFISTKIVACNDVILRVLLVLVVSLIKSSSNNLLFA
uniref:Uncharacterized protein n=1 Tax=Rhizophagus irregularis (strain DAOM 181602 / DAOM 197198 / MUCL 43194) TaxID=747089 RepID=U9UE84_RHIID